MAFGLLLIATPRLYVAFSRTEYRGDCAYRAGFYWNTRTKTDRDAIGCMRDWDTLKP